MDFCVIAADYSDPEHAAHIVQLLNCYALDRMGGGAGLSEYVRENLVDNLAEIAGSFSVLCYAGKEPAGLAICFRGFSTFRCRPLLNIHDIIVAPGYRRLGVCQKMLETVEAHALHTGCCKLTLEVLDENLPARKAYEQFGFRSYELDPELGRALFWEKSL